MLYHHLNLTSQPLILLTAAVFFSLHSWLRAVLCGMCQACSLVPSELCDGRGRPSLLVTFWVRAASYHRITFPTPILYSQGLQNFVPSHISFIHIPSTVPSCYNSRICFFFIILALQFRFRYAVKLIYGLWVIFVLVTSAYNTCVFFQN